eukprot:COSAG01_NODE_28151_length_667_cov_81.885563_1_plen_153_part_00
MRGPSTFTEMSQALMEWLASVDSDSLAEQLAAMGVKNPDDLLLLTESETQELSSELLTIPARKFTRGVALLAEGAATLAVHLSVRAPSPVGDRPSPPPSAAQQVDGATAPDAAADGAATALDGVQADSTRHPTTPNDTQRGVVRVRGFWILG